MLTCQERTFEKLLSSFSFTFYRKCPFVLSQSGGRVSDVGDTRQREGLKIEGQELFSGKRTDRQAGRRPSLEGACWPE